MRVVLFEDERGYLLMDGNELTVGSKVDDPPKVRVCMPITARGGGGGVFSFSRARLSAVCFGDQQDEMGYVRIEQAEDVRGQLGNLRSEINVFVASGVAGTDVERIIAATWDSITRMGREILKSLYMWLGSAPIEPVSLAEGNFRLHIQGDGNLVVYDTHGNADSATWEPVMDRFSMQGWQAKVVAALAAHGITL